MENLKAYRKEFVTKRGRRVLFRPLREGEDVDELLRFINDLVDEDTFINMTERLTREEESKWLSEQLKAIEEGRGFNLLALHGDRIIADAGVGGLGRRSQHVGGLGIAISRGFREEGIGSEFMKELITLARDFLKLKMLFLHVFGNNERAVHVYQSMGFRECGRIPGAILYQGEYIDDVLMCLDLSGWESN